LDTQTAFITGTPYTEQPLRIRYFSPQVEVAFCGHATVAASVAIGERYGTGTLRYETNAGPIDVEVFFGDDHLMAEIISVESTSHPATRGTVRR
jgi:PhzF family phenazine biosynthesis protein